MPLFGNTDAVASKPKWLSAADAANTFFVSLEEAQLEVNKAKGIRGAGWYLINERVTSDGETSYKTECLVAMSIQNAISGDDADDAIVGDVEFSITLQPVAVSVTAPAPTSFTVGTTDASATYVWQVKVGSAAYVGVVDTGVYSDASTATLAISDSTGLTGLAFRCITTNSAATASVTSKGVKLTVAAA
jgi:hypothetical protein